MGALKDRLEARLADLQSQLDRLEVRFDGEKKAIQLQMTTLAGTSKYITDDLERAVASLEKLDLLVLGGKAGR